MPDAPDGSGIPVWVSWIVGAGTFVGTVIAGTIAYLRKKSSDIDDADAASSRFRQRYVVEAASLTDSRPMDRIADLVEGHTEILKRIEGHVAVSRASDVELITIMRERMRLDELKLAREQAFREGERRAQDRRNEFDDTQTQGPHRRGSPNK